MFDQAFSFDGGYFKDMLLARIIRTRFSAYSALDLVIIAIKGQSLSSFLKDIKPV